MTRTFVLLAGCAALLLSHGAIAADAIGKVDRIQGQATGTLAGAPSGLAAGGDVYLNEIIATGAGSRVAVTLIDGTSLTIGENATLTLDEFVYAPNGENRLHATVVGVFRFVSGAHAANREASVTTPVATIGVRGTDFWGGLIDGRYGIVVLDGSVSVTTPSGASATLDQIGMGVDIDDGVTTAPIIWGQARRERALATVTFQ
jgi:hypothetical protein